MKVIRVAQDEDSQDPIERRVKELNLERAQSMTFPDGTKRYYIDDYTFCMISPVDLSVSLHIASLSHRDSTPIEKNSNEHKELMEKLRRRNNSK